MPKEKVPSWVLPEAAPPPESSALDNLNQYVAVANRALAPYATAATLGAAAGAPFAGVGAPVGAAGGVLSLGAADLGTGLYNLAAPAFGGNRVPLPSETIQNQFARMGVGRPPETPAQQVFSDVLQAGAGGATQAIGAKTLGATLASPRARNIMQFLGENAKGQVGAAVGGAAAPSVAANYFDVTDPWTLATLSLIGGVAGGRAVTPKVKVPTAADIKTQASAAYDAAKQAGVRVSQPALSQLYSDLNTKLSNLAFIPGSHPEVRRRLAQIQQEFRGPIDLARLDSLHSDIASTARKITNDKTRMYMEEVAHGIDDFIKTLKPAQTTAGNSQAALSALEQARQLWRTKSQMGVLDDAFTSARNKAEQAVTAGRTASFGDTLRKEFAGIANNKRVFSRLTPELQTAVRNVANGNFNAKTLGVLSGLSPVNIRALLTDTALGVGAGWAIKAGAPAYVALPAIAAGAATGVSAAAKPLANRMAINQAERARIVAAGGKPNPPFYRGPLAAPISQQVAQSRQRGEVAQQRRDVQQPPWWALGF